MHQFIIEIQTLTLFANLLQCVYANEQINCLFTIRDLTSCSFVFNDLNLHLLIELKHDDTQV